MLEKVDPQHTLNADSSPSGSIGFWVIRLYRLSQIGPCNNLLHLVQKLFLAGLLSELLETTVGQRLLTHRRYPHAA